MTIRDRIFDKLDELNMTQKDFSQKTGIPESTTVVTGTMNNL